MGVKLEVVQEIITHAQGCALCYAMVLEWMRSWRLAGADLHVFLHQIGVVLQVIRNCRGPLIQEDNLPLPKG
jgi:hypothetical protein